MYEVVGANKKTDVRFCHYFNTPVEAYAMKRRLMHSPTAYYVALWCY